MTDTETTERHDNDSWLTAVFAAAAGPVIDSAFADRILSRLRKRQQTRLLVIGGTAVTAATLVLWQLSGLSLVLPTMASETLAAPGWLTNSPSLAMAGAVIAVGLTAWMFTDEA